MTAKAFVRSAACALAAALLAATASADDFKPAPHGAFMIDLDTMDGHFSIWRQDDVADLNAMRLHVAFNRRGAGKYAPMAGVSINAGEKKAALLRFTAFSDGALYGEATTPDAKEHDAQVIALPPRFKEPFDILVSWTPEGKVTFRLFTVSGKKMAPDGEHHTIELGAAITSVQLIGSTSEIEFGKVELGTVSP